MTRTLLSIVLPFALAIAASLRAAPPDFSPLDAQIQKWIDAKDYPGAGILIVDKTGRVLHERYWGGYTRETTVMMASASKWVEAATLMALVDDRKLALDLPISTYLPELTGPQGLNTLRQMFSHTSSLNWIEFPKADEDAGIDRFPELLATGHTDVKPGEVFHYGGTALATSERAVEVVAGLPWLTVFAQKIAKPCGMRHTVTGHNLWTFDGVVGASTFPMSNAADYSSFLLMLLNDGQFRGQRVLSAEAVREMQADQVRDAKVEQPEYPEKTLGQTQHGIYGLGEWRLILDAKGEAEVLASPSFAGFFPWIDKKLGIAGVFVARAEKMGREFDPFHASAVLVPLTREALPATP